MEEARNKPVRSLRCTDEEWEEINKLTRSIKEKTKMPKSVAIINALKRYEKDLRDVLNIKE